jgi:L-rhamnose-H+ transport protein
MPPIAAYLTVPDFGSIIQATDGKVLAFTYLMGVLWSTYFRQ